MKLKNKTTSFSILLKTTLGLFHYNALIHHINKIFRDRYKGIKFRHEKKLQKFGKH